jgi:hypothetical protein
MEVRLRKSNIPILWLDTFAIINLTKVFIGESISAHERDRFSRLLQLLQEKVQQKKLICVQSSQLDEIKLGRRLVNESNELLARLSVGNRAKPPYGIERQQLYIFIHAYFNCLELVEIGYKEAFFEDPIKDLLLDRDFIIYFEESIDESAIKEFDEHKKSLINDLENLRKDIFNRGITFDEQLSVEYLGNLQAIEITLRNNKEAFDFNKFTSIVADPLNIWYQITGRENDLAGLLKFYKSEYHNMMPYNDIKAKLYASILTEPSPIASGDSIDIINLACLVPYCNMVLTDRKMCNRMHKLSIDTDYNVNVFALKDYEDMMEYINVECG